MKQFKINLDRKKLTKDYIESKQNFDSVLGKVAATKPNFWKSAWFYGSVGLSGVAVIVGYSISQSQNQVNETLITQNKSFKQELSVSSDSDAKIILAQNVNISQKREVVEEYAQKDVVKIAPVMRENKHTETMEVEVKTVSGPVVVEPVKTEKAAKPVSVITNSMPSISGVYNGDISWENFKSGTLIIGENIQVKSFNIQYTSRLGDKTVTINGDKCPEEVLNELGNLGLNQTIFITNVVAEDTSGSKMRYVSMDYNLKFK